MKSPEQRHSIKPEQEALLMTLGKDEMAAYGRTLLVLFAQICDSAASGTNAVLFLGLTEKKDSVSIAFKVQGQTVSVFGSDVVDALRKADSLL